MVLNKRLAPTFDSDDSLMLLHFIFKIQRSIYLRRAPQQLPVRFSTTWKSVLKRKRRPRVDIDSFFDPREDPVPVRMSNPPPSQPKSRRKNKGGIVDNDGAAGKKRGLPKDSPEIRTSKTLSWILRHGAKSEGITMRPDGYVEVKHLLNNNRLRDLSFISLEKIVNEDPKNRYSLICEADVWLIRANQGHSIKAVQMELEPITSAQQIPMAVHGTTRKAWESISTQGLSKMTRNHVHLAQGIAGQNVISGMRNSSQILIYIDVQKALDSGLEFFISTNGVILSEGDERGFILPEYFKRVETSGGKALPGWEGPVGEAREVLVEDQPASAVAEEIVEERIDTDEAKDGEVVETATPLPQHTS